MTSTSVRQQRARQIVRVQYRLFRQLREEYHKVHDTMSIEDIAKRAGWSLEFTEEFLVGDHRITLNRFVTIMFAMDVTIEQMFEGIR